MGVRSRASFGGYYATSAFRVAVVILAASSVDAACFLGAFGESVFCNGRYFTQRGILPPLTTEVTADKRRPFITSNNATRAVFEEAAAAATPDIIMPQPSILSSGIPVTYTNNPKVVDDWLLQHLPYDGSIIGFDVERLPHCRSSDFADAESFSRGATVQLATPSASLVVHLVRRNGRHSHGCAPILKAVLEDENYVKAGCAIDGDLLELHDLWGDFDARSRFDLGVVIPKKNSLPKIREGTQSIHNKSGLKSLSRSILGVHLPKEHDSAQSDWSTVPLTENQIVYAARDAWAGAAIAEKLAEYDPDLFGLDALVDLFQRTETPLSDLAERRRKREEAKDDLQLLLQPYSRKKNDGLYLPKKVQRRARKLRSIINSRIIDHHFVFETDHHLEES